MSEYKRSRCYFNPPKGRFVLIISKVANVEDELTQKPPKSLDLPKIGSAFVVSSILLLACFQFAGTIPEHRLNYLFGPFNRSCFSLPVRQGVTFSGCKFLLSSEKIEL